MVGFGQQIKREAPDGWGDMMLDYEALKHRIKLAKGAGTDLLVRKALENSFQHLLDSELEKVLAFYKTISPGLVRSIGALKAETGRVARALHKSEDVERLASQWVAEAQNLHKLLLYLSLNLEALRKILKKANKSSCLSVEPRPGLVKLRLQLGDWNVEQGSFLPADIVEEINVMKDHPELEEAAVTVKVALQELDVMRKQHAKGGRLSLHAFSREGRSSHRVNKSLKVLHSQVEKVRLAQIQIALDDVGNRAKAAASIIEATPYLHLVAKAGIFTPAPPENRAHATVQGLLINLAGAFLYMTNYNLVLPTNEAYLNHLDSSSSYAGAVVGFSDLTAVAVSFVYGWWSNHTFKQPLVASSLLSLLGNLLYVAAWDSSPGGLALLLASRLLVGLGSCRAVNRRYIADFVSKKRRTAASAAFVAASAGGAAIGPLLVVPLAGLSEFKVMGHLSINPITAGGALMAVMWLLYTAAVWILFKDPPLNREDGDEDGDERHEGEFPEHDNNSITRPLLGGGETSGGGRVDMQPVWVTIYALFTLKFVQQGTLSSFPEFAHNFYAWTTGKIGVFLCVASLAMLPLNFVVAILAARYSDRKLLFSCEALSVAGLLLMLCLNGRRPLLPSYVCGALLVYGTTIAMESCSMSLLSKKIPGSMRRSTCNAGLLATQAGSFGRFLGNMAITLFGALLGGGHLSAKIVLFDLVFFGTLLAATAVLLVYTLIMYRRLD